MSGAWRPWLRGHSGQGGSSHSHEHGEPTGPGPSCRAQGCDRDKHEAFPKLCSAGTAPSTGTHGPRPVGSPSPQHRDAWMERILLLLHTPNAHHSLVSTGAGTPCRSPSWAAGSHVPEPSPAAASRSTGAGRGINRGVPSGNACPQGVQASLLPSSILTTTQPHPPPGLCKASSPLSWPVRTNRGGEKRHTPTLASLACAWQLVLQAESLTWCRLPC